MQLYSKACVILNPNAASGKVKRRWSTAQPVLERKLEQVEVLFTEKPNHATQLTRRALQDGADLIIAVGGDGTLNEVVNGFFLDDRQISPDAALALLPIGTGGDFRRSAGLPSSLKEVINLIASGTTLRVDVGKLRLTTHGGEPVDRYFINLVSFGMGGEVSVHAKTNFLSSVNGKAAFFWATIRSFIAYRAKKIQLELDGKVQLSNYAIVNIALGNGNYHGGGMHPCPLARLNSGSLDVTVIDKIGMFGFLVSLPAIYSNNIYRHPKVHHFRAKRILASSDESVLAEVDGESLGGLPMEASVLPRAIKFAGIKPRT